MFDISIHEVNRLEAANFTSGAISWVDIQVHTKRGAKNEFTIFLDGPDSARLAKAYAAGINSVNAMIAAQRAEEHA